MRLPDDWVPQRATGWFELHSLTHTPCGWNTRRAFDLIGDEREVRAIVYGHSCAGGDPDTYIVQRAEPGLWTVGHHDADGHWHPDSDHDNRDDAEARATELNGEP